MTYGCQTHGCHGCDFVMTLLADDGHCALIAAVCHHRIPLVKTGAPIGHLPHDVLLPQSAFETTNRASLQPGGAHFGVFTPQLVLFIGLLFKLNPFNFRSYSAKFPTGAVPLRPPFNIVESDQNKGTGLTIYMERRPCFPRTCQKEQKSVRENAEKGSRRVFLGA